MIESRHYVTGIALSQLIYGAQSLDIDVADVLTSCGLNKQHLIPSARVPEANYEQVVLILAQVYKKNGRSTGFGIDIGRQTLAPLYGVLMPLALSSSSLGEALTYIARYQGLATGSCGEVEYGEVAEGYQLTIAMTHQSAVVRRHIAECVMTKFCGLIRFIANDKKMLPQQIQLEHAPNSESDRRYFESVVRCPVVWGTGETQMLLSKKVHQYPILGHERDLLRAVEKQAQQQLEKVIQPTSEVDKIKWHTSELMLSSMPRREIVAIRLNISTRTLDRRLSDAGTSWQKMVDDLRLQTAIQYLAEPQLTISEIAEKLGFGEIRAFQRKFKSWTGLTPTGYRKDIIKSVLLGI
jgi:AraC-like DNA-binding protein